MIDFDTAFDRLISHEGGYVNDPKDPGGETNWGISKRTYPHLDIKNLTRNDAKEIYRKDFWDKLGSAHPAIKFQVFDFAVNSGPGRAAKFLQELVGVKADGAIGPMTLTAVSKKDSKELIRAYNAKRQAFLESLPTFATFGNGWTTRVAGVKTEALAMTA